MLLSLVAQAALAIPITIDPGLYSGRWRAHGALDGTTNLRGLKTVDLPVRDDLWIQVHGVVQVPGRVQGFLVDVKADGTVVVDNPAGATGGVGRLTFTTVPITVDPGPYDGLWSFWEAQEFRVSNPVHLIPSFRYHFAPAYLNGFPVEVHVDGTVSVVAGHEVSAWTEGSTLHLHTAPVEIAPGDWGGWWRVSSGPPAVVAGEGRCIRLVPGAGAPGGTGGIEYYLGPASGGSSRFRMFEDGSLFAPPTDAFTLGTGECDGAPAPRLAFNTVKLIGDASTPTLQWGLRDGIGFFGDAEGRVVPDNDYNVSGRFGNPWVSIRQDGDACTVTPGTFVGTEGTITLRCEVDRLDQDEDGVGDADDNCPGLANADQSDRDADGDGDVCDACPDDGTNTDPDADGVCGSVDNCPDLANADQSDLDFDTQGDACDPCPLDDLDDVDADGHCGDVDNGAEVTNTDQVDSDLDLAGDVCDPCPLDAEDDADADGVCGDEDACPDTVLPDVPTAALGNNRYADIDGDLDFDTVKGSRQWTLGDTDGCSCTQIIVERALGEGHVKFGCAEGEMAAWIMR